MMTFVDDEFSTHFNAGFMPTWVRDVFPRTQLADELIRKNTSHSRAFSARADNSNASKCKLR